MGAQAAKEAEREAWAESVREEAAKPLPLVVVPVNLGGAEKVNLTLYEGEELVTVVKQFCVKHRVPAEGQEKLEKAVRAKIPDEPTLLIAVPVIIPAGVKKMVVVKEGENATIVARKFCVVYNITGFGERFGDAQVGFAATLIEKAEHMLEAR